MLRINRDSPNPRQEATGLSQWRRRLGEGAFMQGKASEHVARSLDAIADAVRFDAETNRSTFFY